MSNINFTKAWAPHVQLKPAHTKRLQLLASIVRSKVQMLNTRPSSADTFSLTSAIENIDHIRP
jgi:hypothetical protein